jgi:hypothetical protein
MKNIIIVLAFFSLLFIGCASNEPAVDLMDLLSEEEIIEIVKADKDYDSFIGIVGSFEPEIINISSLSPKQYDSLKDKWDGEDSNMNGMSEFIDELDLTDSTYMVEMKDSSPSFNGLLSIIDAEKKESLLIVHRVTINAGISG